MYLSNHIKKLLFSIIAFFCFSNVINAQMKVQGTVRDAKTKEPLAFVTIDVADSDIESETDENGYFELSLETNVPSITFSFLGYEDYSYQSTSKEIQTINVLLQPGATVLDEIVIKMPDKKYRNKNNPAVELIRKVIENKEKNRFKSYQTLSFEEYEKIQFALSNKYEKLEKNRLVKQYSFLKENIDTLKVNGKAVLPIFIEEVLSDNFQTFSPNRNKKIIKGQQKVTFSEDFFDNAGIGSYVKHIYQKVDIYDNNINILTNEFLSPIANVSPTFYKFYIRDTLTVNGTQMVDLFFKPRNETDLLFTGNLLITLDGNYAVQNVDMRLNDKTNVNWIKEMQISQEFERNEQGKYIITKSKISADFGLTKNSDSGIYGERTLTYKDYKINRPIDEAVFSDNKTIIAESATTQDDAFWEENRHETMSESEQKVFANMDTLQNSSSFKRTMNIATLLLAGYTKATDYFEIGPVNTFYSFNPVEGFRLRFGGRTTQNLSKNMFLESYVAYGFKDEKWKYYIGGTYSFSEGKNPLVFPGKGINVSYQQDTKIPGQELQFVQEDNFLLSFKRGENDKWLYNKIFRAEYYQEFESRVSYKIGYKNWIQEAAGGLYYTDDKTNNTINNLTTSEVYGELRWAPNEQFYQGKLYRTPFPNKYPIFTLRAAIGIKDFLNGDADYQKFNLNIYKRFYMSQLGFSDIVLEGGYTFGKVPYPLLDIHRANQSYSYQLQSYNLMNFTEFVSDQYVSLQMDHTFNGFIFNKIPLINRLKLKEFVSMKVLYGGLRDENRPTGENEGIIAFPLDASGNQITYSLEKKPYVEGSVGIGNIFKFFRVDLVRRFSYLDHPNVSKWGVRARFKFDF